ncbi:MAG: sigma-54 dependent transcriptional regulator [Thermoanaerobaculia bacterium]|nr:sigma-54 dependent transcriptional regulator [Thermoanaerobaculia bacterium]
MDPHAPDALLVDDDPEFRGAFSDLVAAEGFRTREAESLAEARSVLAEGGRPPDVILLDLVLPDGHGNELLEELEERRDVEVILVTGQATVKTAVEALRRGAYDYLTKPVDVARLKTLLARLQKARELKREVGALRTELRELGRFGTMVGKSPPMQRIYDLIAKVAPTGTTAFVVGESGTGKELVAETVHRLSPRRDSPLLALNCGAISESLIESELFGHEEGSFTGAERRHRGHFERASGGTLFLDEVTEMPIGAQAKLLRILETGKLLRVGGSREVEVDVRVIAATNRNPEEAVAEGTLRKDLLYRLNVFPITLPPLRARAGDVELLARHFLEEMNRGQATEKRLTVAAISALEGWRWPGNVRELENVMQRAYILAGEEIDVDALPPEITGEEGPRGPSVDVRVGMTVAEAERRLILATLERNEGSRKDTAESLGVSVRTLYNRLKEYES